MVKSEAEVDSAEFKDDFVFSTQAPSGLPEYLIEAAKAKGLAWNPVSKHFEPFADARAHGIEC
jgi:hypothetical protein